LKLTAAQGPVLRTAEFGKKTSRWRCPSWQPIRMPQTESPMREFKYDQSYSAKKVNEPKKGGQRNREGSAHAVGHPSAACGSKKNVREKKKNFLKWGYVGEVPQGGFEDLKKSGMQGVRGRRQRGLSVCPNFTGERDFRTKKQVRRKKSVIVVKPDRLFSPANRDGEEARPSVRGGGWRSCNRDAAMSTYRTG